MKRLLPLLILILFSCQGEKPHQWIAHVKERYIDEHNKIITNYLYDISFPLEMGLTQRQIYIFEEANRKIIDETREIGYKIECQELK